MVWASLGWVDVAPWPQLQHDSQRTGRGEYPGPDNPYLKWIQQLPESKGCSVVIGLNNTSYVAVSEELYAFHQNGNQKWCQVFAEVIHSCVVDSNGLIYVATRAGELVCVRDDETKATIIWSKKISNPFSVPSLSLDEKTVYVASDDGTLYFVETSNGNIKGSVCV